MEMNTRLQVEHPVTEMITGQDLVEWQLRVASGEPCRCVRSQLEIRGHALEARIYAENPEQDFLPSTGRLVHLCRRRPKASTCASTPGIEQGDEITPFYDPMIAKLIVWDVDRDAALARMRQALADYRIVGVSTNVDFLSRLVACPAFADADLDTGLIERSREFLFPARSEPPRNVFFRRCRRRVCCAKHAAALSQGQPLGRPLVAVEFARWLAPQHAVARTITYRSGETVVEVHGCLRGRWLAPDAGMAKRCLPRGRKLESGQLCRPARRRTR
jgi:3-methylcrotonyl-CoA carboxylase alpha subunit